MLSRRLRVLIIDLAASGPAHTLHVWLLNQNLANIMPQVVAKWCEDEGHEVTLLAYVGQKDFMQCLPDKVDIAFIGSFTQSAQLAYAMSNLLRSRGAVTALGGPHSRSYPEDAQRYFDYVLGLTDRALVGDVLADCSRHRPTGVYLSARRQPASLPGLRERWKFIEPNLRKTSVISGFTIIASTGCPYNCSFCIDSDVPYQPMDLEETKEDLQFILTKAWRPRVAFCDPNWGVRFDECLNAIQEAVPPGRIDFIAESSLTLLSEPRLLRMRNIGFKAILPGIESWYDMGKKSGTGSCTGQEKMEQVAEHINLVLRYIPFVSPNFLIGFDEDRGREPFELTKRFVELTPAALHSYLVFVAFGRAAPLNFSLQSSGRVLPLPFHMLGDQLAFNVVPKGYTWEELYDNLIDLTRHTFSLPRIVHRYRASEYSFMNIYSLIRSLTWEREKLRYFIEIRNRLRTSRPFRRFFAQETSEVPEFFWDILRRDLGQFWEWLPEGAKHHDPYAYQKSGPAPAGAISR